LLRHCDINAFLAPKFFTFGLFAFFTHPFANYLTQDQKPIRELTVPAIPFPIAWAS
jgi:hypothetical protein